MPITASQPVAAFTLYYHLDGSNSDTSHPQYRSNNPWNIAKEFCTSLPSRYHTNVLSVKSLDMSVFLVTIRDPVLMERIAEFILNTLGREIGQPQPGDTLVAAIPKGDGTMIELVHTP